MSKHWSPRPVGRRSRRVGLPSEWDRYRRRWRVSTGELRMMVLGGIFLGLGVVLIPGGAGKERTDWPAASWDGASVADPSFVQVIDGDTFRFRGEKIRIADIDTPEVNGRCAHESRLAAQATTRMRTLLHAGPFELHRAGNRDEDRYGRKLRVVTRDGRSLGDQLVAEGLARTWTGRREPWC